jgi:hypothetical protein
MVRVRPGWPQALEAARRGGAEDEAAAAQRALHRKDRALRDHHQDPENEVAEQRLVNATTEHEEARAEYRASRDGTGSENGMVAG